LLFAAGTIIYCARALLSFKELLCVATFIETDADGQLLRATQCNGNTFYQWLPDSKILKIEYDDTLDYALSLAFGIIAQLVIFIADGMLVSLFSLLPRQMVG
jgi:hypothetical protein